MKDNVDCRFVTPIDKIDEIDQVRRCFAENTMSDHLMLLNIYQQWKQQRNYREKNQFCFEHFLNANHMRMIDRVRNQLRHLIRDYFATYTGESLSLLFTFISLSLLISR